MPRDGAGPAVRSTPVAPRRSTPAAGRLPGPVVPGPVPPGSGWPGDPASARTPRAATAGDVAALAGSARSVPVLDARVSVCRACPRLVTWREEVAAVRRRAHAGEQYWGRPAPGWGEQRADLLVLGLAPSAHGANRTGRVFTGDRSGDWLFAALHRAGLVDRPSSTSAGDGLAPTAPGGLRVVAAVRCAPPDNAPTPEERDACAPWLDRELALVRPRAVLVLGGFAWAAALGAARRAGWSVPVPRPSFGHGARAALSPAAPGARQQQGVLHLVGSYHVSQQNTSTGRLTAPMLDEVVALAAALAAP